CASYGLFCVEVFRKRVPLFHGLDVLFVVETIGGRLLHRAAIHDRDSSPFSAEARQGGSLAGRARSRPLAPDLRAVLEEPVENFLFLRVEEGANSHLTALGRDLLVAGETLLREEGVVGEQLGCRLD